MCETRPGHARGVLGSNRRGTSSSSMAHGNGTGSPPTAIYTRIGREGRMRRSHSGALIVDEQLGEAPARRRRRNRGGRRPCGCQARGRRWRRPRDPKARRPRLRLACSLQTTGTSTRRTPATLGRRGSGRRGHNQAMDLLFMAGCTGKKKRKREGKGGGGAGRGREARVGREGLRAGLIKGARRDCWRAPLLLTPLL